MDLQAMPCFQFQSFLQVDLAVSPSVLQVFAVQHEVVQKGLSQAG